MSHPRLVNSLLQVWNRCRVSGVGGRHLAPDTFPFDPYRPVLEVFFLPDRNNLLQTIDRVVASLEGHLAVSRGHDDYYTRFGYLNPAKTMNDPHSIDGPALLYLTPDLFHRANRHWLVAFVFKVNRGAAF